MRGDRRIIDRLIPATELASVTNGGAPPDYVPPTWDGPSANAWSRRCARCGCCRRATVPASSATPGRPIPRLGGPARATGNGKRPARAARARAESDTIVAVLDRDRAHGNRDWVAGTISARAAAAAVCRPNRHVRPIARPRSRLERSPARAAGPARAALAP